LKDSRINHYAPVFCWARAIAGCRYEFRTEDANTLSPERVVIWFDGLPGSRKACLPPSCLAGPLSRFQGSKGWACPGSGARAACSPFVF
jgi:hypothetical protein